MPKVAYVGTFDPVHNGHADIATRAAAAFDEVIVGVYKTPPTKALMFDTDERVELFAESVRDVPNIRVVPFTGLAPDFAREMGAKFILRGLRAGFDFELEFEMALMWKHIAPDIDVICILSSLEFQFVYSSRIKEVVALGSDVSALVPAHVNRALLAKLVK
ncbi:MAG: pantetheine-phosphate adenylyltransferase [SAR202 cluster bacterium]|jgi:pantetheine-phosphate adenylyltransferase|nr:pantetheine-phosphate adenylyltransferase [Chloroflexota bacterium]MDP6421546.1 pantetheine-phosphate adenylyltransferase [SAR202 cluster bacterium]MDP6664383.1 pantetheine-phosphate adenylyltransferase [SAR202 cluster bacterium]MDP6800420.1 pantetheine-phosphate adenylyltransferase [SAR202 cluster bacterium]MQG57537.1 pantetheine-phosphate adenylyltransferase [SAR202 cluster bacterium]|tara:strand:- start:2687 stop:3169 length:483 start_codon:yes stop_codon:yes gene_type:complete